MLLPHQRNDHAEPPTPGSSASFRALSATGLARLRRLLEAHCGLFVSDAMAQTLPRRLQPRLAAAGFDDLDAYCRWLEGTPAKHPERDAVAELVTTHESYFFREPRQLDRLCDTILPELMRARGRTQPLRLWSAGCAQGEEPYTLAMLLLEAASGPPPGVEIFGSDISRHMVQAARAGVYREVALRQTSPARVARFFAPHAGAWQLRDAVRRMVTFGQVNLLDAGALHMLAYVDIVFCRNVLIYLAQDSRTRLIQALFAKLRPGGYLLLGHSESLLNVVSPFEVVKLGQDIVYRRPQANPA